MDSGTISNLRVVKVSSSTSGVGEASPPEREREREREREGGHPKILFNPYQQLMARAPAEFSE